MKTRSVISQILAISAAWIVTVAAILPENALAEDTKQPQVTKLIQQLGDDNFETREKAQQTLIDLGQQAVPLLQKAAESTNAEVAFRARQALRAITSLDPAEQKKLRALGFVSLCTGDHATMLRSYRRLSQVSNASLDDHRWHGHAEQLLGNWREAAKAYIKALDQIDLMLKGQVVQSTPPSVLTVVNGREDLIKQRHGLLVVAARLLRDLADDPKAAEQTLLRAYQFEEVLEESLDELEAKWREQIAEALRTGKTTDEIRRESRRHADLYFPLITLRELARTQELLKKPKDALNTWRRVHFLTRVYLGYSNSVDANAVGRLVQVMSHDEKLNPPGAIAITKESPMVVLDLADPEALVHAYSEQQDYWTFALSPPQGKEFATVKFDCDIEQFQKAYGGQFECWTEIGCEKPSRKGIGSIGWPHDQALGRGIQSAQFDIEPGTGPLHVKAGSWPDKFKTHRVTVTATFRQRVEEEDKRPQPTPGFRIQNECLPKGGQLRHNGEPYSTEVASHNVLPGRHTYAYTHPERKNSQSVTIDAKPGRYYGLFFNLDSPFASRPTNLHGFSSRYGASSSFVQMQNGQWLAVWANDSLHFATSRDLVNWSEPWESNEAALYGGHYNCVMPSLYVEKEGTIYLAYFSNRLDVDRMNTSGYRLFVMKSKDGKTWSPPRLISLEMSGWPPGIVQMLDGPDGKVWMIYRLQFAAAGRVEQITRFEKLEIPATEKVHTHARNPHAVMDDAGRLHLVWDGFGQTLYYSRREVNGSWRQPVELWDPKQGSGVSHPQFFIDGDKLALLYSRQGAFIQRGRFVEGSPVFGRSTKITHHVAPLVSAQPRRLPDGQLAILCGADTVWLRTVEPNDLFVEMATEK